MERNLPAFVVYHVLRTCKILIVVQIKFFCLRTTANIDLLMVQGTAPIRATKKAGANARTDLLHCSQPLRQYIRGRRRKQCCSHDMGARSRYSTGNRDQKWGQQLNALPLITSKG
jgi:hypothetical protein